MDKCEDRVPIEIAMGGLYVFMKDYFRYERQGDEENMEAYLVAAEMAVEDITELLHEDEGNLIRMPRRRN
jgi:hypothetical protein